MTYKLIADWLSLTERSHCKAKAPSPGIISSLSCWSINVTWYFSPSCNVRRLFLKVINSKWLCSLYILDVALIVWDFKPETTASVGFKKAGLFPRVEATWVPEVVRNVNFIENRRFIHIYYLECRWLHGNLLLFQHRLEVSSYHSPVWHAQIPRPLLRDSFV